MQKTFVGLVASTLIVSLAFVAVASPPPRATLEALAYGGATSATVDGQQAPTPLSTGEDTWFWLNHFDLLPGSDELTTTHKSTSSGVGGGLTGLVIESTTMGDTFADGGNKVVHMAANVPPGLEVNGMRICYELTSNGSFITQARLAQVADPPSSATVMLDDETNLTDVGPACVDTSSTLVDPSDGALLVSLRLDFGDTADKIVVRGLALGVTPAAAEDIMWVNHFDLLTNAEEDTVTFASTSSGVGGGLTGLVFQSSTSGDTSEGFGSILKGATMGVEAPPGTFVTGVRVCYENSNTSHITQVRLSQIADPPEFGSIWLDDGAELTAVGPTCVDSASTSIDADAGAIELSLRFNVTDTTDKVVIRGLALILASAVSTTLDDLTSSVEATDSGDYSNANHRKTFLNKLNALGNQIAAGETCEAVDKLTNDLLPKTDGETPPPDWVTDAFVQAALEARILALLDALMEDAAASGLECGDGSAIQWLNLLDLQAGDEDLTATLFAGGWLQVTSGTTGDEFANGGGLVIHMAVSAPVGYNVTGVRVCYSASDASSSNITQVRLAQVNTTGDVAWVLLDDGTALTDDGPICVDTSATSIDPASGALLLSLRFDVGDTADMIMIRGVALNLERA